MLKQLDTTSILHHTEVVGLEGDITRLRVGPSFAGEVFEPDLGSLGYIVIDSTVNGWCCGGVRMSPDVSLPEVADLARAMTLKFGYVRSYMGGAKIGIRLDPESCPDYKRRLLKAFGKALVTVLKDHNYIFGTDMGTTLEDIHAILEAAGIKAPRNTADSKAEFYTGLTVLAAAEAAARYRGLDIAKCTLAVEGFGKVGGTVARLFSEKGAKVVAISTAQGAIYDEKGLNIDKAIELYHQVGDRVVEVYDSVQRIKRNELLELPVTILSPCAGWHSINSENALRVAARIICPGANASIAPDAEKVLTERGILSIPDFIANCGGVLADSLDAAGRDFTKGLIEKRIGTSVARILNDATNRGLPVREVAESIAKERFCSLKLVAESRKGKILGKASRLAFKRYQRTPLPELFIRPLLAWYAIRRMKRL
ncbi:MAG TPA: Glu/Leu/Phe/Val dehydrogenase [Dehalococcoidia bacterium]|nr:Glu/Leu/Phe/Val dehydrogenase [Dehalococcoidia bacterium]